MAQGKADKAGDERPDRKPKEKSRGEEAGRMPPAGPHARPDLTNPEATPGAGTLPPAEAEGEETDPGAG